MTQDSDIYKDLQRKLISGWFSHGEKLRAEKLKSDYGCSASTVRESLFRLSTEELVEFQEQRGFRVPQMSARLLSELTHVRILLEAEGTVMSIERGGVAWEAKLTAVHHQLSHIEKRIHATNNPEALVDIWFDSELEFHQTLIAACDSETLKALHLQVYRRFRQQLMVADRNFDFISKNIRHHHDILQAAIDGNRDLTRRKIHDHLARHLDPANRTQTPQESKSSAM